LHYLTILFALFLFVSCSGDSPSSGEFNIAYDDSELSFEKDSDHEGFIKIGAKGHFTYLGTNDVNGSTAKERPLMKVMFDYDFSIAEHEITIGEYAELMGGEFDEGAENKPIVNVSYGDVVLFANNKSKSEGLDTVYSYSGVQRDVQGHVKGFEHLVIDYGAVGYRLPTEAEWVFVAARDWNPSNGWNEENSDNEFHYVCTKERNSIGVCDMSGNVTELVGDWLAAFRDTTISNFVGAYSGDEMVIKGGSYRNSPANTTLYRRGATYDVRFSDYASYIGARLAIGAIKSPSMLSERGVVQSSLLKNLVNASDILAKFGTLRSKLVFVEGVSGQLAYVDYAEKGSSVRVIEDSTLKVFHPDVSPDGEWVAFSTVGEGNGAVSSVYVRRLNPAGEHLTKLDVESAAIPRFGISAEGDTVITYVDNAGINDTSDFKQHSTWQVTFANGKFGTPKKLFNGAYHSGVSPDYRLAISGARRLKARMPGEASKTILDDSAIDSVWYGGAQACNASLATDGSKRTLFLDFGKKSDSSFVGKSYGVHEQLLIADSTGKLIQHIASPSGFSFDHSEWVRGENIAVATLASTKSNAHEKIVLVDVKDSSVMELLKGEEVQYPCLWVDKVVLPEEESFLNLDSAGVYMTSDLAYDAPIIMSVKMRYFWEYREVTNVAILGSSRTFSGVDPVEITSFFAVNLAYAAEDMTATEYFADNYFIPLMPKLKALVISLDYDRWGEDANNWVTWFGAIPGYKYDEKHDFWKDGVPKSMLAAARNCIKPIAEQEFMYGYNRGLYYSPNVGYSEEVPRVETDNPKWFEKSKGNYNYNLSKLETVIKKAKENKIVVVGVVFPQSPLYIKNKGVWGKYGLSVNNANAIAADVKALAGKYSNFVIMDEYNNGDNDYAYGDFSNDDHLGLDGAVKLTKRLDSLLVEVVK